MKHRFSDWLKCVDMTLEDLQDLGISRKDCSRGVKALQATCRDAWECGLLRGFNGNMSVRLDAKNDAKNHAKNHGKNHYAMLVTATGVAKGHLKLGNIALASSEGKLLHGQKLSSETAMHVATYKARKDVRCILHVHPPALLALSLRVPEDELLRLPLFEAAQWRDRMVCVRAANPGSAELAHAVADGFADGNIKAVFLREHGLCAVGATPLEALGICEQLEHLAITQVFLLN